MLKKNYSMEKHDTQTSKRMISKFANPVLDVTRKYFLLDPVQMIELLHFSLICFCNYWLFFISKFFDLEYEHTNLL